MDGSPCPATGDGHRQHDYVPDPADPRTPRIRTMTCRHCKHTITVTNPP